MTDALRISVAYALPDRQRVVDLSLPTESTARQAVLASGLDQEFPDLDLQRCAIGIYGHVVPDDQPLRSGDRVEIYRPLEQDPREARRAAVARGGVMGARKPPRS